MIGTVDIKVNAAHPNMPLLPIYAFVGSPSQVRIINVPKAIGKWAVTSVQITANYPDNTSRSVTATLVGGCWSATLPASTSVGQSLMGFKVTASGTDEAGAAVTGYVLGKGDVFILNDDSTITIGETTYYVHLVDSQPATPKKGDLCKIEGAWKMYNGTAWEAFGGGSGDVKHSEFSDMTADLDPDESSIGEVMTKVNALITKLKGTTAAIVAILAFGAFAAVDVQTAKLSDLPGKTLVVTNVAGAAASSDVIGATNSLATVAHSGQYSDLSGKPTIPTSFSYIENAKGEKISADRTYSTKDILYWDLGNPHGPWITERFYRCNIGDNPWVTDKVTWTNRHGIVSTTGDLYNIGYCANDYPSTSPVGGTGDWYGYTNDAIIAWRDDPSVGVITMKATLRVGTLALTSDVPNAYTKSEADDRYLQLSGGWMTGKLYMYDPAYYYFTSLGWDNGRVRMEKRIGQYGEELEAWWTFPQDSGSLALHSEIPTASSLRAVTYAANAPESHKTAAGILSSAENTAGTKDAALFTTADYLTITNGTTSAATKSYVQSQNQSTRAIVETWESFLDGSNVVFSITNYISGTYNLDNAKLRILEMTNGVYREVFNSRNEIMMHLDSFRTNEFASATNTIVNGVIAVVADKADKDWGKYTSAGGEAPSNTVYMTAPSTVFAGGLEYERVAVGEGMIGVLTTKGAPTYTTGDEGTFKFQDDGGTNYFGFAKTDSYTIGCDTDGISVNNHLVTLTYNVTMSGVPCIWYKGDVSTPGAWEQLNTPDGNPIAGASHLVSWEATPAAGTEVCYINCPEAKGFFKATIEVAGSAKFMTNMPADLGGGIMCTNTATGAIGTIVPSYNGSSVNWTWRGL